MFVVGSDTVIFNEVGQMVVRITDPVIAQRVQSLPYVQILQGESQTLAMLPWNEDACKMFQNAGLDMAGAAPFWHMDVPLIEGKYNPMKHQLFTAAFMTLNPRCYILSDPRTGKTGSFILGIDYMQKQRMITGGVLIITTVTTMHGVWGEGIKATLPNSTIEIIHGKNREVGLERPAEFYITNYDSVRLAKKAFVQATKEGRIGAVGIDEMTHIGNPSSQRHKAIDELCNKCGIQNVIGLTGSPGGNVESVYGMCRMVNRHKLPCTTKGGWLSLTQYQYGPEPFMVKPSPNAPKIIHEAMMPAVRFNKADIIDLPPITYQDRECSISREQESIRNQFKQQAVALFNSGETISASNGGVLHIKLMQTALGFTIGNDGKVHYLDYSNRLQTIIDIINETDRPVVIFCVFKAAIERLAKDLRQKKYTVETIDGSITGEQRAKILTTFQNSGTIKILIAHPTTVSFGTELSASDCLIFNGPPQLGTFIYQQAVERLSSVKQTSDRINIINVYATPEEKKAFRQLESGHKLGQHIASLFEEFTKGII